MPPCRIEPGAADRRRPVWPRFAALADPIFAAAHAASGTALKWAGANPEAGAHDSAPVAVAGYSVQG